MRYPDVGHVKLTWIAIIPFKKITKDSSVFCAIVSTTQGSIIKMNNLTQR